MERGTRKQISRPGSPNIIPFMPKGLFFHNTFDWSLSRRWCLSFFFPWVIEIPVFNANFVDPDQTPRAAASDLGLQSLPVFL